MLKPVDLKKELAFGGTYCPLPFIDFHLNLRQERKLCCISSGQIDDHRLHQIRNDIRTNQKVNECSKCYEQEAKKLFSMRQRRLTESLSREKDLLERTLGDYNEDPVYYDLRYSNLCNLECQTCNPVASSAIAKTMGLEHIFIQHDPNIEINPNAKRIYFAGGEPFLIKSFGAVLEQVTNKQCEIVINTNVTVLTEHLLSKLDYFKNVSFTLSIDGYGQLNERIRKNSKWADIEKNIKILSERYGGNTIFLVNTVVQRDNVNHLLDLGKWLMEIGINKWRLVLVDGCEDLEFHHCRDILIPDELRKLPIVAQNLETMQLLNYIKNYAKN